MTGIQNFVNVDATDPTNYPNGALKDDPLGVNGVPLNKDTLNDMELFFDKMMRVAGFTANNLLDNETNGYQTLTAMQWIINANVAPVLVGMIDSYDPTKIYLLYGSPDPMVDGVCLYNNRIYFLKHYSGLYGAGQVAVCFAQDLLHNHGEMALMIIYPALPGTGVADYTDIIRSPFSGTWTNVSTYSGTYIEDASYPLRYKKKGSTVYIQGWSDNSSGVSGIATDEDIFTLPIGLRPAFLQNCIVTSREIPDAKSIPVNIAPSGVVTIKGSLLSPGATTGGFTTNGLAFNFSFELD